MGVLSKFHRYREAGEQANVNNVERFGEPEYSLFTSTKVLTLHHEISITDDRDQVVYQAKSKFPSLHDKTDIYDAAGNHVSHIERKFFTLHERHFVTMEDGKKFELSNEVLASKGYRIKETASVRVNNERSASGKKRAAELDELVQDKDVDMILCAAGGDFMLEMMPYVNFDHIRENPKWICGMSDPTNLLFPVTTMLDIATLYGTNGAGFTYDRSRPQSTFFRYAEGDIVKQNSYNRYITFLDMINENHVYYPVKWQSKKEELQIEGRRWKMQAGSVIARAY